MKLQKVKFFIFKTIFIFGTISLTKVNELLKNLTEVNKDPSFQKLFQCLFKPVLRFVVGFVKSVEAAEEITGDVFYQLWKNREKLREIQKTKYYVFTIARNLSINYLKKQSGRKEISLDDVDIDMYVDNNDPELLLISNELQIKLQKIIDCLPKQCKLVFKLVKEDGFTYKQTAEILNISVRTVNAHMVAAVKKLYQELKNEYKV